MVTVLQKNALFQTGWKLAYDADNVGKSEKWYKGLPEDKAVDAYVPSYVHMFLPDCRGIAWYELEFDNKTKDTVNDVCLLRFDMVEYRSEVYLNGKFVGEHEGNEDVFEFDVTNIIKRGKNRLSVRVSKPHTVDVDGLNFYKIPHRNEDPVGLRPGRCNNSYGIHGDVHLNFVPKVYVSDTYLFANTETGNIEAEYTIINKTGSDVEALVSAQCFVKRTSDFVNSADKKVKLVAGENKITLKVKIEDFLWWDISDPNLYNVVTAVTTDQTEFRNVKHCGFRTFKVDLDNGFFYLNGRRIYLRCSHTGNCMPESCHHIARDKELLRRDFSMAKAAGFNMVRFISGVALQEQLDYCDELGLMVYEEPTSGWLLYNSKDAERILEFNMLTMVKRDRSHPCVTIFGILNETGTRFPYDGMYMYARKLIKKIRKVDKTRLVLYSSGRWDSKVSGEFGDPWSGSFSNPFTNTWQCAWNCDSEIPRYYEDMAKEQGVTLYNPAGDIHDYPRPPVTRQRINELMDEGAFPKRPVLFSEIGIGSLFNVLWLDKKFEAAGALDYAPDVLEVRNMAKCFTRDYKRFGFEGDFAYAEDILRTSEIRHNRQRDIIFNIVRGNPYCNGVSLTGLLDHSICGEGLFTLMREWKPGIADTLQDGFAPLRWCMFIFDNHVYRNRSFDVKIVLANEDVLKPDTDYPVSIKIMDKDRRAVFTEDIILNFKADELKLMSVPVFEKSITLNVPTGEYELRANLLKGAAAYGGSLKFYVTDPSDTKAETTTVVGVALSDTVKSYLKKQKIKVVDLKKAKLDEKAVIVVGNIPEEERDTAWEKIKAMTKNGSRTIALSRYSFVKGEDWSYYLPLTKNKPVNFPAHDRSLDWLYHFEYIAKRDCPYFKDLPTGVMDWDYYTYIINSHHFTFHNGEKLPDKIHSAAFSTGIPTTGGYLGGVTMGTYKIGKGALTFSCYSILENIDKNPVADKMLINMIDTETKSL